MRSSIILMAAGILVALAGGVFTMQGLGLVGPSYSFMFQSGQWVYEGLLLVLVGVLLLLSGVILRRRHPRR